MKNVKEGTEVCVCTHICTCTLCKPCIHVQDAARVAMCGSAGSVHWNMSLESNWY